MPAAAAFKYQLLLFSGHPYFDNDEVEKLLGLTTELESTLGCMLKGIKDKKSREGKGAELCASHDVALL